MRPTPIQELQATAVHEAAHAVLTALFGFELQEVTIEPKPGSLGCVTASPPSQRDHPVAFEQIERRIMSLLAGVTSVQFVFPNYPKRQLGGSADQAAIEYLLRSVCYSTEETRKQALKRLRAVTVAWVGFPNFQQMIRLFANKLLVRKTPPGRQATRLFTKLLRSELSSSSARPMINWELFSHEFVPRQS